MNINEASEFFKGLISETKKKSEIKIYNDYLVVLSALKEKELSEEELQSIDKKLNKLDLKANPEKRKKYLKQKFLEITSYLKKEFSLVIEGYYSTIGIAIGPGFGMVFGMIFLSFIERSLGLTYGIMAGMVIGYFIGLNFDAKAEKQNRVLKTK
jgi:hypothetical protein